MRGTQNRNLCIRIATPAAASTGFGALIDLILTLGVALMSILTMFWFIIKRRRDDDEEELEQAVMAN